MDKPYTKVEASGDLDYPIRIVFYTAEGKVKDVAEVRVITGKWVKAMEAHAKGQ